MERGGYTYVVATIDDYKVAYDLLSANAPRVLELCSKSAYSAYKALKEALKDGAKMSTSQIQQLLKKPKSTVKRWLSELTAAELLSLEESKRGRPNIYSCGIDAQETQDLGLVHPDNVCLSDSSDEVSHQLKAAQVQGHSGPVGSEPVVSHPIQAEYPIQGDQSGSISFEPPMGQADTPFVSVAHSLDEGTTEKIVEVEI